MTRIEGIFIKLIALMYLVIGGYCLWLVVSSSNSLKFVVFGFLCLSAAFGLFFLKTWSRYIIGAITILVTGGWLYVVVVNPYSGWMYSGQATKDVISIVVSIAVVTLIITSCVFVFRFFRKNHDAVVR